MPFPLFTFTTSFIRGLLRFHFEPAKLFVYGPLNRSSDYAF